MQQKGKIKFVDGKSPNLDYNGFTKDIDMYTSDIGLVIIHCSYAISV